VLLDLASAGRRFVIERRRAPLVALIPLEDLDTIERLRPEAEKP